MGSSKEVFLKKYRIAGDHWRVLTSDAKTIRKLADTFELQYNKGEDGNYVYMHTNFYAVADKTGKVSASFAAWSPIRQSLSVRSGTRCD